MPTGTTARVRQRLYQAESPRHLGYRGLLYGVADGARTHDNWNHNPGLYRLSYSHR